MSLNKKENQAVTREYKPRYHKASKKEKKALLDESPSTSSPLSLEKSGFRSNDIFHLHKIYDSSEVGHFSYF
jgi:hypothetical protein